MASKAHDRRGMACTTCGRVVLPGARYCRACYTVVRDENDDSDRLSKLAAAFKLLTAIAVAYSGVWFYQSKLSGHGGSADNVLDDWLSNGTVNFGRADPATSDLRKGRSSSGSSSEVRHENPIRRSGTCTLKQTIESRASIPVRDVPLVVTFEDARGKIVGEHRLTEAINSLGQGETRVLTLDLPCPDSVAAARVQVSPSESARGKFGIRGVVLRENPSEARPRIPKARAGGRYTLAKHVPDLSLCPPPGECKLAVSFDNQRTSQYTFRRSPDDPRELTSSDQIVVGYLLANDPASLRVAAPQSDEAVTFTSDDLISADGGNPVVNWFDELLG